jgi:hypothetical protein
MRYSDWIRAIVLAAVLATGVQLSVAAVADPPRFDEPAMLESLSGQHVEEILGTALGTSLEAVAVDPGTSASAATLRSRS